MRPAIILSVILIVLSCIVYKYSIGPIQQETDRMPVVGQQEIVTFSGLPDLHPMVDVLRESVATLQEVQQILAENEEMFAEQNRVRYMTSGAYALAEAIIEERAPKIVMSAMEFDQVLAGMFVNPNDPNAPMEEHAYDTIETFVRGLSERKVAISKVTESDPIFAKRAKREWKTAHIFIRVEKKLDDGSTKTYGVVLSASEPKSNETSR